jgi:chromosome segregation protein
MLMRVTRLELFGFKSFPERAILPLEGGITGIVGPNGCGKSNVVDALRWVLGETRASQLRGGLLEDVIFNGTEGLRPLGLAEVTLTLRSNDVGYFGGLTSPMAEAKAVMEAVVSEQSAIEMTEDTIPDGGPAALIGEQFSLSPGSSLEGQPNIEANEILDPDSATFARRFSWLADVSEVQVTRRLYRSGESEFFINKVQCRLKDLKDFFRAVGISARSYTIVAQGEVGRIVTSKPADRRAILEEAAGVAGFRDQAAEAGRRLAETLQNVTRIDDIVNELGRQVQSLSRQAQRAERRAQIKDQVARLEELVYFHRKVLFEGFKEKFFDRDAALEAEEEALQDRYDAALQSEADSREQYETIEQRLDSLQADLDSSRSEATRVERERSRVIRELSEAQSIIRNVDQDIERLQTRAETLEQRRGQALDEIAQLESDDFALEERIVGAEAFTEEAIEQIRDDLRAKRTSLNEGERYFRTAREHFIAAQSRCGAVEEQVAAASPLGVLHEGAGAPFARAIEARVNLLADLLTVPEGKAKAVQAWLDVAAQFFVAEDPLSLGSEFLEFLESLPESQRGSLGIGAYRAHPADSDSSLSSLNDYVPFVPLKSCLSYEPKFEGLISVLFRDVFFVDSTAEALHFLQENVADLPLTLTLVSAQGELITRNSFFSKRHEGGAIQLKSQLDGLRSEVVLHQEAQEIALQECQVLEDEIAVLEDRYQSALDNQQVQQREVRELGRQQGSVKGRLIAVQQLLAQIGTDISFVQQEIAQNRLLRTSNEQRGAEAQEALEMYESHSLQDIEERIELLREGIDQSISARAELRENFDTLRAETERLGAMVDDVRSSRSQHALEARRIEIEFESLKERILEEHGPDRLENLDQSFSALENPEPLPEAALAQIQDDLREQRASLLRIGEVDPTVVETYRVENERLLELKGQSEDLTRGAKVLSESIERLTKTSEERFLATFAAVRDCFSGLIPRLFGGGSGDLELSNPNAPLDSGVDILVKPPGKKPKSIDVLSGGEKALCATALIFSLFRQRPSPLCVLDEVDAPLDEANLNRFLDLIRDTCDITQFLLITHNKVSMGASDRLVGVTMPQPGASRLISVSLQEAERHVA